MSDEELRRNGDLIGEAIELCDELSPDDPQSQQGRGLIDGYWRCHGHRDWVGANGYIGQIAEFILFNKHKIRSNPNGSNS